MLRSALESNSSKGVGTKDCAEEKELQWRFSRASDDTRVSSRAGTALQRGLKRRPGVQDFYQHIRPAITCRLSPARKYLERESQRVYLERALAVGHSRQHSSSWRKTCSAPRSYMWVFPASTTVHHYVTWMHFLHAISSLTGQSSVRILDGCFSRKNDTGRSVQWKITLL